MQAKVGAPAGHRGDASTGMAGSSSAQGQQSQAGQQSQGQPSKQPQERRNRVAEGAVVGAAGAGWEHRSTQVESVVGGVIGGVV